MPFAKKNAPFGEIMLKKGLIQIYTGDGKGKTTAAIGQAIRAFGSGLEVCYVSFFKNDKRWKCGELSVLKRLAIDVFSFAEKHPHFDKGVNFEQASKECKKGTDFIRDILKQKKYDVLILDEILVALHDGFIEEDEVLKILQTKPLRTELILTGRGTTRLLLEAADLVTEMKKEKHPYDTGVEARKGIEY